jgi:hypothetical protein
MGGAHFDNFAGDLYAELRWLEETEVLDVYQAILAANGPLFHAYLAQVEEYRPELSHFDQQAEAKKRVVCSQPDGPALWERLEEMRHSLST